MVAERESAISIVTDGMRTLPLEQVISIRDYVVMLTSENTQSKPETKLAADGILHHLADPSKIPSEEGVWAKSAVEKYKLNMEEMNEAD